MTAPHGCALRLRLTVASDNDEARLSLVPDSL